MTERAKVDAADLRRRIEKMGELPTLPDVVHKIVSISARADTSAEDLERIIEKDQVLAAKVLRLANSPFYGFPTRIASVSHAVVVLGLNVVKGLTLCATAFDLMKAAGMDQLWRHSLSVAIMAHILAARAGLKNQDEVFVAGLLHDIGKVVLYVKFPDLAPQIEQAALEHGMAMRDAEQEVLGLTHAEVSGWLAGAWHLPASLKDPLMFHHRPALALEARCQTALVHVADILAIAMGCGASGDDPVPPLCPQAWTLVGLEEDGLAACLAKADEEFQTMDDYL